MVKTLLVLAAGNAMDVVRSPLSNRSRGLRDRDVAFDEQPSH
jgi:hypothetical protein